MRYVIQVCVCVCARVLYLVVVVQPTRPGIYIYIVCYRVVFCRCGCADHDGMLMSVVRAQFYTNVRRQQPLY